MKQLYTNCKLLSKTTKSSTQTLFTVFTLIHFHVFILSFLTSLFISQVLMLVEGTRCSQDRWVKSKWKLRRQNGSVQTSGSRLHEALCRSPKTPTWTLKSDDFSQFLHPGFWRTWRLTKQAGNRKCKYGAHICRRMWAIRKVRWGANYCCQQRALRTWGTGGRHGAVLWQPVVQSLQREMWLVLMKRVSWCRSGSLTLFSIIIIMFLLLHQEPTCGAFNILWQI